MTLSPLLFRRFLFLSVLIVLASALGGCVSPVRMPGPTELQPDKYLFDRGTESLQKKRWLDAREYFQKIIDAYPQSPYRQQARLGVGDSHLGQGGYDQFLIAAEAFREFLRFYPLNERADYAQYRLTYSQFKQMLSSDRDQTPTIDTLREAEVFLRVYPNSSYRQDLVALQRQARDRLSTSELDVGRHYFRDRWYAGAIPRFEGLLKVDPTYAHRDAAYYYLAESFYQVGKRTDALPYYQKLVEEFKVSEFLGKAKMRADELTRSPDSAPASPQGPAATPARPAAAAQQEPAVPSAPR